MLRRSFLFAAALAAASLLGQAAQAASITVTTDSGNLGAFNLTNTGVSGNTSTLVLTFTQPGNEIATTINGVPLGTNIPMSWLSPITLTVTNLGGGLYGISTGTYTKMFNGDGSPAQNAILSYVVQVGSTGGLSDFLNLAGAITAINSNPLVFGGNTYDFSSFVPGGQNRLTLTGTSYTGASTVDGVISTLGATWVGSASFSEVAVPEPTSLALLGIGLSGLLSFRRYIRRATVA